MRVYAERFYNFCFFNVHSIVRTSDNYHRPRDAWFNVRISEMHNKYKFRKYSLSPFPQNIFNPYKVWWN